MDDDWGYPYFRKPSSLLTRAQHARHADRAATAGQRPDNATIHGHEELRKWRQDVGANFALGVP